ncbi:AIM24 family protein [Olsenella profusa]|uniref:AIM24 family protein n=1 Tax=Olsenella profusa TaxID=138595 RepID=A0ABS2F1W0_9ACTN|nr:AIM24 family protein [Olsenella profusa]MBM6774528.1 AIM24 family protein [Olsenella profusa]
MRISNFLDNDDARVIAEKGPFKVVEWQRDLSVAYLGAQAAYFAAEMGVRRRQLVCALDGRTGVTLQAGLMQWMAGDVRATTGIKGVGDLFGKALRGSVTGESAIKPEYVGSGTIVCEPTYRHVLLMNPQAEMGGTMVINDGLFMACTSDIKHRAIMVKRPSAVVAGNEGLFNLGLEGSGYVALESPVPVSELVVVDLDGDELKVDGNFAIAWSDSLAFTVERSGKSLVGSAVSGEGLVNTYRGTGRVLLSPVASLTPNPNAGTGEV